MIRVGQKADDLLDASKTLNKLDAIDDITDLGKRIDPPRIRYKPQHWDDAEKALDNVVHDAYTKRPGREKLDNLLNQGKNAPSTFRPNSTPVPAGHTRVYRAVSEAEYQDILSSDRLRQGPNSLEGKWFADSLDGANAHGKALFPDGKYRLVEVDVPNNARSLHTDIDLDGRGPARYLHNDDLPTLFPRPLE